MEQPLSYIESTFSRKRTRQLLRAGDPPHISLFVPTHRAWNKRKENRLMLDGLVKEAQMTLEQRDFSEGDARELLQPASDLVDNDSFWRTEKDGLAVFVARNHFSSHRLPFSVPKRQFVDKQFHVRPLWRHLEPNGRFYLLALSQGSVKLLRGSRYVLREVELENVPTTLEEALQFDEHIRSVTFHTGTRPGADGDSSKRAAMYHGQEDSGDKVYVKEGILRFFRELDNEVRRILGQEATPPPLVLAGVEYVRGLYRQANHYPHVTESDVEGHLVDWTSGDFDVETLHQHAWSIVESLFDQDRTDAEARFDQLAGNTPEQVAASIETAVPAAYAHRIDTLFVSADATAWGRYDADAHQVTVTDEPTASDLELLNATAVQTLEGNGTLYVVDPADVPRGHTLAAILRY